MVEARVLHYSSGKEGGRTAVIDANIILISLQPTVQCNTVQWVFFAGGNFADRLHDRI